MKEIINPQNQRNNRNLITKNNQEKVIVRRIKTKTINLVRKKVRKTISNKD